MIMGVIIAISGLMLFFIPCVRRYVERKGITQHEVDMGRKVQVSECTVQAVGSLSAGVGWEGLGRGSSHDNGRDHRHQWSHVILHTVCETICRETGDNATRGRHGAQSTGTVGVGLLGQGVI